MEFFSPHDGTGVEARGCVLVFRSQAHLDQDELRRLQGETMRRIQALAGQPWAILGIVDEEAVLLTPDAEAAGRHALPQLIEAGLAAQAVAFNKKKNRALIQAQVERIVRGRIPLQFFDSEAEAEAWLNGKIAAK